MKTRFGFETEFPENTEFYDVREGIFDLYGLLPPVEGEQFRRVPADVAEATSEGVAGLAKNTAGGRVRFITDSGYVAIHAELPDFWCMDHFALTGSNAFDIFVRQGDRFVFKDSFRPPVTTDWGYEKQVTFADASEREVLIHRCREGIGSEARDAVPSYEAGSVLRLVDHAGGVCMPAGQHL